MNLDGIKRRIRSLLIPPETLSLAQWAEAYAYLSAETSSAPGKFHAFGYQNGILDAITDETVETVTVMKAARTGYTKCLDNVCGYFIHHDPAPVLVVMPRESDCEDYSRTEIVPMLRDTPVLAAIAGEIRSKDPQQRILKRVFPNSASISFVGANSPAGFRRITARIILFDEIDGYPVSGAGSEGDQLSLGKKRSESFWDRKVVMGSTPTLKGFSRIESSFKESDQRFYFVACPHCGAKQTLRFANLRWDKAPDGAHLPGTAHFVCEASGCIIEETSKPGMIAGGEWVASKPFHGHAGFHIWAAYSLFPNACWRNLVEEFLRVRKDPILLQTYVNTVLGETWEALAERIESSTLSRRVENYSGECLPLPVTHLTAGIDVQGDRLEAIVTAWGQQEECWVTDYAVFLGDPAQQQVWADLDRFLLGRYYREDGQELRIKTACIDTGGHHAAQVISFCKSRKFRRIFPTKGMAGPKPIWPKFASRTGKRDDRIFMIGVDSAKDAIYGRLRIMKPGPGYVHFPVGDICDSEFFAQLTSEQVQTRHREGRPYRVWILPPGKRNEVLDCFVLALAARLSSPRIDPMLDAPRPVGGLSEAPNRHIAASPFPVATKVRKSVASMLAR
jgi:phage terminase large subunit GpA-like protein